MKKLPIHCRQMKWVAIKPAYREELKYITNLKSNFAFINRLSSSMVNSFIMMEKHFIWDAFQSVQFTRTART
ncbi:hypothetical protein CS542_01750 [Pedobacter sp. IW39]|nr:hypothetical protein CS542_01750 [Pedobacter sp. IW39]